MILDQRGDKIHAVRGKFSVHIATIMDNGIRLQQVDPTMAAVIGLELDERGFPLVELTHPESV